MAVKNAPTPDLVDVTVERERKTKNQNRIDLRILGRDWCLIVENKIRHIQINPFHDYEDHARGLRKQTYFAILSPDGDSAKPELWKGVSYKNYCASLRQRLGKALFDYPHSKWYLFAREFILHIENELDTPAMNEDEVKFVEEHTDEIVKVQKLMSQYRTFARQELQSEVDKRFPEFAVQVREEVWPGHAIAFRCTSPQWKEGNDMQIYRPEGAGQKIIVRMMLNDMSEPRLSEARHSLEPRWNFKTEEEIYPGWSSPSGHNSASEAISEFCELAQRAKRVLTM
jgi:hypothetical protein